MPRSASSGNTASHAEEVIAYRMPAEFEPHAATWLAWPHYRGDWPGKFQPIPWVYAEIIRNLARHEHVELIVNDAVSERTARKFLKRAGANVKNVRFHRWPTDRVWLRDSGCIFVAPTEHVSYPAQVREIAFPTGNPGNKTATAQRILKGHDLRRAVRPVKRTKALTSEVTLHALTFRFNAWAKYSNFRHDEKIGALMARIADAPSTCPLSHSLRVVLEGGSIDVNGRGTILTTEECLLGKIQQRNPHMKRRDYEKLFADYLGASNVIWLGKGIRGDDTHGHVDDLSRFVAPDTVVTAIENNPRDANYKPLQDNLRRLRAARDQDGKALNIVEIPMPRAVIFENHTLPASYANFFIANEIVLVPVFNDPNDRIALNTLASLFPTREIIPIYSGDLVWGFGTLHCMTQQQPADL